MIRGLDVGIKRQISAKLRERGLSESEAQRLAEDQLSAARKFFESRLSTHQASGKPLELAIDDSFVDLAMWTKDLDTATTSP